MAKKSEFLQRGQTLVTLLIFMAVAATVTSAIVTMLIVNSQSVSALEQNVTTLANAESGAENALLRLERDPNYSGETMSVGDATVVISVTGDVSKTITSAATAGNFLKKIEVIADTTGGTLTVSSWRQLP